MKVGKILGIMLYDRIPPARNPLDYYFMLMKSNKLTKYFLFLFVSL